jgi:hypothetical protein
MHNQTASAIRYSSAPGPARRADRDRFNPLIYNNFWKRPEEPRRPDFRGRSEKLPVWLFYTSFGTGMSGLIVNGGVA